MLGDPTRSSVPMSASGNSHAAASKSIVDTSRLNSRVSVWIPNRSPVARSVEGVIPKPSR